MVLLYNNNLKYFNPFSKAFLANNPAAIITSGLDVFVHEVIAANTTVPFFNYCCSPL
jgi:hypothetical protein